MQIIPVIDVKGGVAVRARGGDRANYAPLETPLSPSADPIAVARGLTALHPFATVYVADLDGIEGRGPSIPVQTRFLIAWPGTEVWIDDGSTTVAQGPKRRRAVVGSESMGEAGILPKGAVLSLDFRGSEFQGPNELLENPALWPARVIVMQLARVGSGEGPDMLRLVSIIARAEGREVFAAGGVRGMEDIHALREIGAAGALVSTALHRGRITPADLAAMASAET